MIYLCTFLLCVAMAKSQWKVVMNMFSHGRMPNLALNNFPNSITSFILSLSQGTFFFFWSMHANPFFPQNFQESLNGNNHWSDEAVYEWCQAHFYPMYGEIHLKMVISSQNYGFEIFQAISSIKNHGTFFIFFRYRKYYSLVVKNLHNATINWMDFVKGFILFIFIDLWHGESC